MMKKFLKLMAVNRSFFLFVFLIGMFVVFSFIIPEFSTIYNVLNMTKYGVEIGLLAFAETLIIISGGGGIDLSIGSILSLSAMVIGVLAGRLGVNIVIASILGIITGGLCGVVNGFFVSFLRIPPLIVTLSTMYVYDSLALLIAVDKWGNPMPVSNFPYGYYFIGQQTYFNIPFQVIAIFIPLALMLHFVLSKTTFGRYLVATGNSEVVARFSSVPVRRVKFTVYVIGGFLAGLAALIMTSRIASARPDLGAGLNLQAITIAVLGGTNIMGGEGSILGTLMAIVVITALYNGLQLAGISSIWQVGTLGIILIGSAIANIILSKKFSSVE
ncbi:MAG: rhamnose transport system permease protein [Thermotogaceae bacterium]|jgi:ribose/xylose/arabinose/galactoside ABC-type transport system permease subunit|nr:rhamnose transport system permease protein [Thermotogaceae bacterium]MDN5337263.1 rhamnose transport system permease protein [Thermotogaceae bacterium]